MVGSQRLAGLAAYLLCMACAAARANPPPSSATLPVWLVDNRPFIAVSINGRGPFRFLLDTGSSSTTLTAEAQRRLLLPVVGHGGGSGAGEARVAFPIVHAADMSVGPFSIGAVDAPAIDMAGLSRAIGFAQFDGVLGAELFRGHVVSLDAAAGTVAIASEAGFKPPAGAASVPYTLDENGMPVVAATVGGIAGLFQVDTGDRSSLTLFGPFWRPRHFDRKMAPVVTAMTGYGVGGPILGIVGRPESFALGGYTLAGPVTRLSLQKGGGFTRADRAGSIGMGVLRRFRVSFDDAHRTMWLACGAGFDVPDRYDRSGLWLGLHAASDLEVVSVTPGSAAAAAGMKAGDLLTRAGGLAAGPTTLFAIRNLLQSAGPAATELRWVRDGRPYAAQMTLRDQIAPPPGGNDLR